MEFTIKKEPDIQTIVIEASGFINTNLAEKMILRAGIELNIQNYKRCFFDVSNVEIDPNQTMTGMYMFSDVFMKADI